MAYTKTTTTTVRRQRSLAERLASILDAVPTDELVAVLQAPVGRRGYGPKVLFRAYLASFILSSPSISAVLRELQNHPSLAKAVGGVPSKFAMSRFISKLSAHADILERCMAKLTAAIKQEVPDLGETVALDSTDVKAWSGARRTDPDAKSSVKAGTNGHKKWWFGFKAHLVADTTYEIPLTVYTTPANASDNRQVEPSLRLLVAHKFSPKYVLADAGYDAIANRECVRSCGAIPIIKRNSRGHKVPAMTDEETRKYAERSGIERVFSRLKDFRRLNRLTMRGLPKASVHCLCSVLVMQAAALVAIQAGCPETMRCNVA